MSKFAVKLSRRIMAAALSLAMVMSGMPLYGMPVYASELPAADSGAAEAVETDVEEVLQEEEAVADKDMEKDADAEKDAAASEVKADQADAADDKTVTADTQQTEEENVSDKDNKAQDEGQASETGASLSGEKTKIDDSKTKDANEKKETAEDVKEYNASLKTDVWDFGGATVDGVNNMMTSTDISGLSTKGIYTYGDLKIYSSKDIAVKAVGTGKGIEFYGINNGRTQTYYSWAEITVKKGDVITVDAIASSGDIIFAQRNNGAFSNFSDSGGTFKIGLDALTTENMQKLTTDTSKGSNADTVSFYAPTDGNFVIISGNITPKSLVIARITREHVDNVTAQSGADLTNAKLTFTDDATGEAIEAAVSSNSYTVSLYNKHKYTISASEGLEVEKNGQSLDLTNNSGTAATKNVTVTAAAATSTLSGSITVPDGSKLLESLAITFTNASDEKVQAVIDKDAKTYTAKLKTNAAYTIESTAAAAGRLKDCELDTSAIGNEYASDKLTLTADKTWNIEYKSLLTNTVNLTVSGTNVYKQDITKEMLTAAGAKLVFVHEDGEDYKNEFAIDASIKLRTGKYRINTTGSVYTAKTPASITVASGDNNLAIEYTTAKEWDFTTAEFADTKGKDIINDVAGTYYYNGLKVNRIKIQNNLLYAYNSGSTKLYVPVAGNCRIAFNVDTSGVSGSAANYSINVGDKTGDNALAKAADGAYKYDYTGNSGYVEISVNNKDTSNNYQGVYFKSITVTYPNQITIAASITNGTVTAKADGKKEALPGDTVKLSDVAEAAGSPADKYTLDAWSVKYTDENNAEKTVNVTGDISSGYEFVMPAYDVTISAAFKELGAKYDLNLATDVGAAKGSLVTAGITDRLTSASAGQLVDMAQVAEAQGKADTGYELDYWNVTYKAEGAATETTQKVTKNANGRYTFVMPAAAVTITPVFAWMYKIQAAAAADVANGTVTAKQDAVLKAKGADKVFLKDIMTAEAASGYAFKNWKVTYKKDGTDTDVIIKKDGTGDYFDMPQGDVTVSAVFEKEYVDKGTYKLDAYRDLKIKGFLFDGFADDRKGHGYGLTANATMTLSLSKKADIVITGCRYPDPEAGQTVKLNPEITAGSGTLSTKYVSGESATDEIIPVYTIKGAAAGDFTLKFNPSGQGGWIHSVFVEYPKEITAGERKIDVWDFGGLEEKDTANYNNYIIPADILEKIAFTTDKKIKNTGSSEFDDLTMVYEGNDRIYSSIEALKSIAYGTSNYETEYADGYTAAGGWYSNGTGGGNRRYVVLANVQKGDKIAAYIGISQNGPTKFYFEGVGNSQKDSVEFDEGANYKKCEFTAEYTGTYKIWEDAKGKPLFNRIVRVPGVAVSGTIDTGANAVTGYGLKFVNKANKKETEAALDGTNFTAVLAPGFEYTAVLTGAAGFGLTAASNTVAVADADYKDGKSGISLVAEPKAMYAYSGKITGFAQDYDTSGLDIKLLPPANSNIQEVELTITRPELAFRVDLESGVKYQIDIAGTDDYEVKNGTVVAGSADIAKDIAVGLKPKYAVSGGFIKLDGSPFTETVANLKFALLDDKGKETKYVYPAEVKDGGYSAELRNGSYIAKADAITGYTLSTHIVVNDAGQTRDLLFASETKDTSAIEYAADIYVGDSTKQNNYDTVNAALDACKRMARPGGERVTVHIAPGIYREQITVDTPNVTLKNDTPSKQVLLTWYYGIGYKYYSADTNGYYNPKNAYDKYDKHIAAKWGVTVYVKDSAAAFRAEGITFENSFNRYITDEEIEDGVEVAGNEKITFKREYGADVEKREAIERAAAMLIEADKTEFKNCGFYSSQDTLYTNEKAVHGYFKNCVIEGNTDYIYGGGDYVFDGCELSWKGYSDATDQGGYITAARPIAANKGYLFRNCIITANEGYTVNPGYFGRPWGADAKIVFINTKLEKAGLITAEGWKDMSGNLPQNANFREYGTTIIDGTQVSTENRVQSTVINEEAAAAYTAESFFGDWTPSYYAAEAAGDVAFASSPSLSSNAAGGLSASKPGNILTVAYSLGEENDANDASIIRWYRVDAEGKEEPIKASNASDKTYIIAKEDTGRKIKVKVDPAVSSGKKGTAAEAVMPSPVLEGFDESVSFASVLTITSSANKNAPIVGDVLTAKYSLDAANVSKDASEITWYRIKNDTPEKIAQNTAPNKSYTITDADAGSIIRVEVTPVNTNGTRNDEAKASAQLAKAVTERSTVPVNPDDMIAAEKPAATPAPSAEPYPEGTRLSVRLESDTAGARIYYTLDGSEPGTAGTLYAGEISIEATTTIKAVAVKSGMKNSPVAEFVYTIGSAANPETIAKPTADPAPGAVAKGTAVTLKCETQGADIYYTTDGSAPTAASAKYTEPIAINKAFTIKAIAVKGAKTSEAAEFAYTVTDEGGDTPKGTGIRIDGLSAEYDFAGAAITPDFDVWDDDIGRMLVSGTDYTVKYADNKKEGAEATVTVIGKGNYEGKEVTAKFKVGKAPKVTDENALISVKGAKLAKIEAQAYQNRPLYPDIVLTPDKGEAVTYKYDKDKDQYLKPDGTADINVKISGNKNKGTAAVLVTGKKDNGKITSVKASFKINPADLSQAGDKLKVTVADGTDSVPYAAKGAEPKVTVSYKFDGDTEPTVLTAGKDYTVKYANNKNAGDKTGRVTITGKGNYAKKVPEQTFSITKLDMEKKAVLAAAEAYGGAKADKLKAVVADADGDALKASQYTVAAYEDKECTKPYKGDEKGKCKPGDKIYVKAAAKDEKNLENATAPLEVTVGANIAKAKVKLNFKSKNYTGEEIRLEGKDLTVTIKENGKDATLTADDYEIVYSNNVNKGTATAIIKGKGSKYSGTKTIKFKITAKTMQKAPVPNS